MSVFGFTKEEKEERERETSVNLITSLLLNGDS